MIWAALLLMVALAAPATWAWYISRRQLAATTKAAQWRVLRLAAVVSAGVGVAILTLGVAAFVLTGYNWLVLALVWSVGLLHLGLLVGQPYFVTWRSGMTRARSGSLVVVRQPPRDH